MGINGRVEDADEHDIRIAKIMTTSLCSLLHILAFLATIVMSKTDTLLTLKYGLDNDDESSWVRKALADSSFNEEIESWASLYRGRLVCAMLAWFMCCVYLFNEYKSRNLANRREADMERQAGVWRWKVHELQGDPEVFETIAQIPSQDRSELISAAGAIRKLMAVQQMGIERSQQALRATVERLKGGKEPE